MFQLCFKYSITVLLWFLDTYSVRLEDILLVISDYALWYPLGVCRTVSAFSQRSTALMHPKLSQFPNNYQSLYNNIIFIIQHTLKID